MKQTIMFSRIKKIYFLLFMFFAASETAVAQNTPGSEVRPVRRLNFMVSTKQKKVDLAPISFQAQAIIMRKYHKKDFYVIIAGSSKKMTRQITRILKRKKAMIGNIWFDSHGHWQRRRSLFEIGEEEFNYKTIQDSMLNTHLKKLAAYCDTNSNVGVGSCYAGATYTLPAIESIPAQRMNGDSLMIGVSKLFSNATVYACESFVMTKPGVMNAYYALAGAPGRKKFKDPIYAPVWERLGEWNCYSGKKGKFEEPVTISLNQDGSIYVKGKKYLSYEKNKKKLSKKMRKFKRGNYNLSQLYQN